jgi:predicted nucleic acid-binding protein
VTNGLRIEPTAREDYGQAWQLGAEWTDQGFSLTDQLCFVAIERARSFRVWSYDVDFAVIRLGPRRDRALEILI